eukprot:TRINITY_DN12967_c0_g1_i2.p1 TRINITY_DN12967_c0_g1~~TRINITY_DN12967_c0_g1_i2.p1  ORF type:complete len:368 (-),score=37.24 TRINITY_DN12967_c0_g1_i2:246-1349(-)
MQNTLNKVMFFSNLLGLGLVVLVVGVWGQDEGVPNPLSCICTDVDPRSGYNKPPAAECFEQSMLGKCDEQFMFDTIGELPEGYCQITCGRCDCCNNLNNLLEKEGLLEFLSALKVLNFEDWLRNSGWQVTLLAPTNEAFLSGLASLGYSRETAYEDIDFLSTIMLYHVLPREPYLRSAYLSPFMYEGAEINTYLQDYSQPDFVVFSVDRNDNITANSPVNSAKLLKTDVESCKGSIQILDKLLVPYEGFPTTRRIRPDISSLHETCTAEGNANYKSDEYIGKVDVADEGECCDACRQDKDCNVWTYCAWQSGCPAGDQLLDFGRCDLKFQSAVSNGEEPEFWDKFNIDVPFISGAVYRNGVSRKSNV